jgi:hypothetical protein
LRDLQSFADCCEGHAVAAELDHMVLLLNGIWSVRSTMLLSRYIVAFSLGFLLEELLARLWQFHNWLKAIYLDHLAFRLRVVELHYISTKIPLFLSYSSWEEMSFILHLI